MALSDNLTAEKEALTALLESEYPVYNLRGSLLERLFFVRFLLGELVGSGGGGSITNYALETGGNLTALAGTTNTDGGTVPTRAVLIGGKHNGNIVHIAVDNSGHIILNATDVQTAADSISTTHAQIEYTETQLTAVGVTTSRSMNGYKEAFVTATVANINTNVVARVEVSNNGTNWANASVTETDTTITANGTYAFRFSGCPAFIRFNFVSESGGTAATIDVIVRLSA